MRIAKGGKSIRALMGGVRLGLGFCISLVLLTSANNGEYKEFEERKICLHKPSEYDSRAEIQPSNPGTYFACQHVRISVLFDALRSRAERYT